jgi:Chlorophyll A-B binding protein
MLRICKNFVTLVYKLPLIIFLPRAKTMQNPEIAKIEDRNAWVFGFTPQAEIWNGRLAMIGFVAALITEILTKQGVLQFWGLI